LLVHNIYPTLRTNAIVDLTLPWAYDDYAFAIPIPVETANINAIVKPFQWQVSHSNWFLLKFRFQQLYSLL
jgi:hypothetical protein